MLLLCFYCYYLTVCRFADWLVSIWFLLLLVLLWQLLPQPILICTWYNLAFDSGKWGQSKLQHTTTTTSQVEKLKLYNSPSVSLKQFCKDLKKVRNTLTIHDSSPERICDLDKLTQKKMTCSLPLLIHSTLLKFTMH